MINYYIIIFISNKNLYIKIKYELISELKPSKIDSSHAALPHFEFTSSLEVELKASFNRIKYP